MGTTALILQWVVGILSSPISIMDRVLALVFLAAVVSGRPDPYILYNGFNTGLGAAYPLSYPHSNYLFNQPGQIRSGFDNNQQNDLLLLNSLLSAIYSNQPYLLTPWSNTIMGFPQSDQMAGEADTAPVVEAKDSAHTTSFTSSNTENSRPKFFTVSNK